MNALSSSVRRARKVRKTLWLDEFMAVRPFGEWAHAAYLLYQARDAWEQQPVSSDICYECECENQRLAYIRELKHTLVACDM